MVGLVINSIIGSYIFVLPSVIARLLGLWSLLAYAVAAAIIGIEIACFAEVSSRFSEPGGSYLYNCIAFGPMAGIVSGWLSFLGRTAAAAASMIVFVSYAAGLWATAWHAWTRIALMSALVLVLTSANLIGVRSGAGLSTSLAVAKLLPLLTVIALGIAVHPVHATPATFPLVARNWRDALLFLVGAFGGFDAAVMSLGEVRDPRRDCPFGLFVGLGLVTVVYIGVQAAVLFTIGASASDRPLAQAAEILLGGRGAFVVSVAALLSTYGFMACSFLNVPRLIFAMGERGDFPHVMTHLTPRYLTPDVAILVFGLAVWLMAVLGSFQWTVMVGSGARMVIYGMVCVALIPLRHLRPSAGFEVPWPRAFATVGAISTAALLPALDKWGASLLVVISLAAVLFWRYRRRRMALTARAQVA